MSHPTGQILPGSKFGNVLTDLAKQATFIVEIGTWHGEGSTRCLANGLTRPEQRLWTVESDKAVHEGAKARYSDPRITFLYGVVARVEDMDLAKSPTDPKRQPLWLAERDNLARHPNVLDQLPEKIDLLLLDGGEFTSDADLKALEERSTVIALDDIRRESAWKNFRNLMHLRQKWPIVAIDKEDRNGWVVFKRP